MKDQKKETAVKAINHNSNSEVDQLKEEVKKLTEILNQQPKSLEEKIKFFEMKQSQVKKMQVLEKQAENLILISEEVKAESEENNFFTENFFFKVTKKQGYSNETELLKIQNPVLISEVLNFALDSINRKKEDLQNLINA